MKEKLIRILSILMRERLPRKKSAVVFFDNEQSFLKTARRMGGTKGLEALSPYPIHELDEILNIKRSWIPWAAFVFGLIGMAGGFLLTWWTSVIDWPLIIGGKPFFSLPAFIPVIFECTILFSALASVAALFWACDLPKVNPPVLDPNLSSHKFALLIPLEEKRGEKELKALFKKYGEDSVKFDIF